MRILPDRSSPRRAFLTGAFAGVGALLTGAVATSRESDAGELLDAGRRFLRAAPPYWGAIRRTYDRIFECGAAGTPYNHEDPRIIEAWQWPDPFYPEFDAARDHLEDMAERHGVRAVIVDDHLIVRVFEEEEEAYGCRHPNGRSTVASTHFEIIRLAEIGGGR